MPSAAEIASLYKLPLSEFTAARNALAKRASGDDAKEVRRLAKPSVVPWTVNQLYWQARPEWQRLLESGRRLREAQIAALKGRAVDLREAAATHRDAVASAVGHAVKLAAAGGVKPAAEPLARMLEAVSLAPDLPGPAGQLTEVVAPAGFEALAGLGALAALGRHAGTPAAAKAAPASRERATSTSARRAVEEHDAAAERRAAAERKAAESEARARVRLEAAEQRQRQAERKRLEHRLAHARDVESRAAAALERAQADVREILDSLTALAKA